MMSAIIQLAEIIVIFFIIYFVLMGRKNDEDLDKTPISFFILGLFFLVLKIAASIVTGFGASTIILNAKTAGIYSFMVPLCFFIGSLLLRKESDYAY